MSKSNHSNKDFFSCLSQKGIFIAKSDLILYSFYYKNIGFVCIYSFLLSKLIPFSEKVFFSWGQQKNKEELWQSAEISPS
jgi:hypothetical protein